MRRETQNILLLLLGGALLKIALTGDYLRYVKASQQPWLIGAGVVMVALAAIAIARDIRAAAQKTSSTNESTDPPRSPRAVDEPRAELTASVVTQPRPTQSHSEFPASTGSSEVADGRHAEHGHHSGHGRPAWLLLLPVLAILLVAPPALGADSVARAGNRAPTPPATADDGLVGFPPLPNASPFDDTLSDFNARAGWDRAHSLESRPARLTGFIAHQGTNTYLARLVIACCAADAFPVKVHVTGADVDSLADDTWVQATVLLVPGSSTKANDWTPSATIADLHRIKEPKDAYEY